jgi:hypothetical protein
MKTSVISYSLTGNNEALAHSLAAALQAEHVRIAEVRQRTIGMIVLDMIFNRTPHIQFPIKEIVQNDYEGIKLHARARSMYWHLIVFPNSSNKLTKGKVNYEH